MTSEDAARIQAYAAIAQTILGVMIGIATVCFGRMANRLLKMQTEANIEPSVTLDLHPRAAEPGESFNYIKIENHSPLDLCELTLSAAIYGNKADCPTKSTPAFHHFGKLPDLGPQGHQLWCIDTAMDMAVELMKIGPEDASPFKGVFTAFVQLHLAFRRKIDGAEFRKQLPLAVNKKPFTRPMAVYPDYLAQLPGTTNPSKGLT